VIASYSKSVIFDPSPSDPASGSKHVCGSSSTNDHSAVRTPLYASGI